MARSTHSVIVGAARTEARSTALHAIRRTQHAVCGEGSRARETGVGAGSADAVESNVDVARTAETTVAAARKVASGIAVARSAHRRADCARETRGCARSAVFAARVKVPRVAGTRVSRCVKGAERSGVARKTADRSRRCAGEARVGAGNAHIAEVVQPQSADARASHEGAAETDVAAQTVGIERSVASVARGKAERAKRNPRVEGPRVAPARVVSGAEVAEVGCRARSAESVDSPTREAAVQARTAQFRGSGVVEEPRSAAAREVGELSAVLREVARGAGDIRCR